jgi:ketosteroid isomerase-like protein
MHTCVMNGRVTVLFLLAAAIGTPSAASAQASTAVRCFYAALNAHDFRAMVACYSPDAVTVRGAERHPVDFEASRGYREFEAQTNARFHFDLESESDSVADTVLHEESDFLRALGLTSVTADWRYVVRRGVIAEEHHTRADSAYGPRYREFVAWARREQSPQWQSVIDGAGNVVFNGATARSLVALASAWSARQR